MQDVSEGLPMNPVALVFGFSLPLLFGAAAVIDRQPWWVPILCALVSAMIAGGWRHLAGNAALKAENAALKSEVERLRKSK